MDRARVTGPAGIYPVTIDTTAPAGTLINAALTATGASASMSNGGFTHDNALTLTRKAKAGAPVKLITNAGQVGTMANGNGDWGVDYAAASAAG